MSKLYYNNQLVFFVGRGRSGTTLLSKILNTHPQISVTPEGLFIRNLYGKYQNSNWNQPELEEFIDDVFQENKLEYWEVDKTEFKRKYIENLTDQKVSCFAEACLHIYRCYAAFQGKSLDNIVLGDKNPHYSLYIPQLRALYPTAIFVHLVRDYRDNILSFKNVDFDVNNTAALAERWTIFNKRIDKALHSYHERSYLLRYEDVIAQPEDTLKNLCQYLGVSYDERMLEFYKYQTNEKRAWHQNIKKPLSAENLDVWKTNMTYNDLKQAEKVCGKVGQKYGYELSGEVNQNANIFNIITGLLFGKFVTFAESAIFMIPFRIRTGIMNFYRKKAGAK